MPRWLVEVEWVRARYIKSSATKPTPRATHKAFVSRVSEPSTAVLSYRLSLSNRLRREVTARDRDRR